MSDSRRAPTQFPYGHLTADAGASADPVLVEIVQGSLASVEMEVETAIGRTSRSPMIRDAHDFRAGIHDRLLRKLTGRSYSALVHPIARDFPLEEMREVRPIAVSTSISTLASEPWTISTSTGSALAPASAVRWPYGNCVGALLLCWSEVVTRHSSSRSG